MANTVKGQSAAQGPQQITVLSRDLAIVRKIDIANMDPNVVEMIADIQLEPDIAESSMGWWEEGFISNDHPRSEVITEDIMAHTLDFGVARTDTGEIIRTGLSLPQAFRAVEGAKLTLAIDVDLADEKQEVEEFDSEPELEDEPEA